MVIFWSNSRIGRGLDPSLYRRWGAAKEEMQFRPTEFWYRVMGPPPEVQVLWFAGPRFVKRLALISDGAKINLHCKFQIRVKVWNITFTDVTENSDSVSHSRVVKRWFLDIIASPPEAAPSTLLWAGLKNGPSLRDHARLHSIAKWGSKVFS